MKVAEPLSRRTLIFIACLLVACGMALAGNGLWIKTKAAVAQVLLERAFAAAVQTGEPVKAWSWADTRPVARIRSARLDESAIVLAGGSGEALAFGPGHLAGTPRPGDAGTSVIAAHRDTHFRFLKHLKAGDTVNVTRDDGLIFRFQVTDRKIVPWDKPDIDVNAAGNNLVLATCWPFDAKTRGTLRYVVHAQLAQ